MELLRDISFIWSLFHVLVIFIFLFESKYSKKKTVMLTCIVMTPLIVFNAALYIILGPAAMAKLLVLTCTIPSLVFFWLISKYHDGRFLFIFCFADTVSYDIIMLTKLIDYYLGKNMYIVMLVSRIILFPLLEWFVYKKLRPIVVSVQSSVKKGWYSFAAIGAIFYIVLLLMSSYPSIMTDRPEQLPETVLVMLLMPLVYFNIFQVLKRQQALYELAEKDNILNIQVENMQRSISQMSEHEEKSRIERHDMRHHLRVIKQMIDDENYDEVKEYIARSDNKLREAIPKRWCANPVLDAVLTSYLSRAEEQGIKIKADIAVSSESNIDIIELSTVFANAIENAIIACNKLPLEQRAIDIKVLAHPQFMMMISNPFKGEVKLDDNGMPVSRKRGHGFGTRSIVAFCEKYNAFYEFIAKDNVFILRIVIS